MNPQFMYAFANHAMTLALAVGAIGVALAYLLPVGMGLQIVGHIITIIAPAFLKLGYVGRMIACVEAGKPVDC